MPDRRPSTTPRRATAVVGTSLGFALGATLAPAVAADAHPERQAESRQAESRTSPFVDPQTPRKARPLTPGPARTLVFSDEFNAATLDTGKWVVRSWARGGAVPPDTWSYSPDNVRFTGQSLELSLGNPADSVYTGACIDTAGRWDFTFGTLEARVKLPPTNGHLAAVWMQTRSPWVVDGSARDGEEIDVVETNYQADKYTVTVHWDGYGDGHQQSGTVAAAPGLHTGWHVFGLSWTPTRMDFTYDGAVVRTITDPNLVSQVRESVLLSHEILDAWADGSIHDEVFDSSSSMYVDYVRVWQ